MNWNTWRARPTLPVPGAQPNGSGERRVGWLCYALRKLSYLRDTYVVIINWLENCCTLKLLRLRNKPVMCPLAVTVWHQTSHLFSSVAFSKSWLLQWRWKRISAEPHTSFKLHFSGRRNFFKYDIEQFCYLQDCKCLSCGSFILMSVWETEVRLSVTRRISRKH